MTDHLSRTRQTKAAVGPAPPPPLMSVQAHYRRWSLLVLRAAFRFPPAGGLVRARRGRPNQPLLWSAAVGAVRTQASKAVFKGQARRGAPLGTNHCCVGRLYCTLRDKPIRDNSSKKTREQARVTANSWAIISVFAGNHATPAGAGTPPAQGVQHWKFTPYGRWKAQKTRNKSTYTHARGSASKAHTSK